MLKDGHRPRRTLVLASWDAEEWHLTGSTEWGEQFARELGASAIAYLNVDSSTGGSEFTAGAVASLNPLVVETARDVIDPDTRRSVLEAWGRDLRRGERESVIGGGADPGDGQDLSDPMDYVDNRLGSGSDYTVFLNFLGIPIVGMAFDGPYGVYHSQYDDYYWMTHFGDPGFRYMTTMGEIWARMGLRLANADVIPYDFRLYAARTGDFIGDLEAQPGVAEHLDLSRVRVAQSGWARAAEEMETRVQQALSEGRAPGRRTAGSRGDPFATLNGILVEVERAFLLDEGIPGRPWFKHVLYAPKYTYDAMMLPGAQEAVDLGDWSTAQAQVDLLAQRLLAAGDAVRRASEAVPDLPSRDDHE